MALELKLRGGVYQIVGTVAGRRVRESTGARCPKQAEELRARREADLWKEKVYGPASVVTFEAAATAYLEDGGEGRFLEPLLVELKGRRVGDITHAELRTLARRLYPGRAVSTQKRQAIIPAMAVINLAAEHGWCGYIASSKRRRGAKAETAARPTRVAVDRNYIDALRARCLARPFPAQHLAALMLFLHLTGARLGEALGLTPKNLDLNARKAWLVDTKNGETRVAELPDELVAELRGLAPREGRALGYVNKSGIYLALKKITAEAGLTYLGTHQPGRHSFSTALNALGFGPKDIADAGGWKSVAMVASVYTHPERSARRAADALGRKTDTPQEDESKKSIYSND